jgi:hypothetical protein
MRRTAHDERVALLLRSDDLDEFNQGMVLTVDGAG